MSQAHCFLATELMLKAQAQAQPVTFSRQADRRRSSRQRARTSTWPTSRREFLARPARAGGRVGRASPRSSRPRCSAQPRRAIASTSAPSAPAGSRAGTICRACGSTTLPGSWRSAISTAGASQTRSRSSTATTPRRPASRTTASPTYADYRELLANRDIDAVVISTPDHWHAIIAIHAVEAGKDVYLQKPASLTIGEGRALSNAVHRSGRIFQIGSQQRSSPQFRYAAELVRNGRIGQLKTVEVGLPGDPSGDVEPEMPVPKTLNYDRWLGSTPDVYYTEKRVHPQAGYDRPGWLRCEQFGAGMITGWGAHHVDSAHWAMGTEYTGPSKSGARLSFRNRASGTCTARSGPRPLRQRRADDRERRVSRTVSRSNGTERLDLRLARQRNRHGERSGRQTEGPTGAGRQRPEDHHLGHWARAKSTCRSAKSITATGSRASDRGSSPSRRSKSRTAHALRASCITLR